MEHKRFEGAMNALFNEATLRQGIDYVLDNIEPPLADATHIKSLYNAFEESYRTKIRDGLLLHRQSGDFARDKFCQKNHPGRKSGRTQFLPHL